MPVTNPNIEALTRGRLYHVDQNYVRGETHSAANAVLIAAQADVPIAQIWGGGLLASVDGIRFVASGEQQRGVDLIVLDQGIDAPTATGRMFFQILGSIAEFSVISARTDVRTHHRRPGRRPRARPNRRPQAEARRPAD